MLSDRFVPRAFILLDIDADVLVPNPEFGEMGARAIAPRNEDRRLGLDRFECLRNVL